MSIDKLRERVKVADTAHNSEVLYGMPNKFDIEANALLTDLLTALEDREAKLTIARKALKKFEVGVRRLGHENLGCYSTQLTSGDCDCLMALLPKNALKQIGEE